VPLSENRWQVNQMLQLIWKCHRTPTTSVLCEFFDTLYGLLIGIIGECRRTLRSTPTSPYYWYSGSVLILYRIMISSSQITTLQIKSCCSHIKSPDVTQSWFKSNHDLFGFAYHWLIVGHEYNIRLKRLAQHEIKLK